jgi:hypothetical protein
LEGIRGKANFCLFSPEGIQKLYLEIVLPKSYHGDEFLEKKKQK